MDRDRAMDRVGVMDRQGCWIVVDGCFKYRTRVPQEDDAVCFRAGGCVCGTSPRTYNYSRGFMRGCMHATGHIHPRATAAGRFHGPLQYIRRSYAQLQQDVPRLNCTRTVPRAAEV